MYVNKAVLSGLLLILTIDLAVSISNSVEQPSSPKF